MKWGARIRAVESEKIQEHGRIVDHSDEVGKGDGVAKATKWRKAKGGRRREKKEVKRKKYEMPCEPLIEHLWSLYSVLAHASACFERTKANLDSIFEPTLKPPLTHLRFEQCTPYTFLPIMWNIQEAHRGLRYRSASSCCHVPQYGRIQFQLKCLQASNCNVNMAK